jgi:hypothetical protein
MLKRFSALFFILAVAGQAFAGVCVCLDPQAAAPKHSCCKRPKKASASVASKGCCETECGQISNQNATRNASENYSVRFAPRTGGEVLSPTFWPPLKEATFRPQALASPFLNDRHKFARPPDLYRRHHSFLI